MTLVESLRARIANPDALTKVLGRQLRARLDWRADEPADLTAEVGAGLENQPGSDLVAMTRSIEGRMRAHLASEVAHPTSLRGASAMAREQEG